MKIKTVIGVREINWDLSFQLSYLKFNAI